jgi:hypothetical protein
LLAAYHLTWDAEIVSDPDSFMRLLLLVEEACGDVEGLDALAETVRFESRLDQADRDDLLARCAMYRYGDVIT